MSDAPAELAPSIDTLRRASRAVYLAAEATAADDLSRLLRWAAAELAAKDAEIEQLLDALERVKLANASNHQDYSDAEARAEKAIAERDAAVKALEPFAKRGLALENTWWDRGDDVVVHSAGAPSITIGHYRSAIAVLPTPNTEPASG